MTEPYQSLLDQAANCRLVTVNERLARRLRAEFDQQQIQAGRQAWEKPLILSAEQWQTALAEQLLPECVFLSPTQDQALWETVIKDRLPGAQRALLQIPATARRTREAHALLCQYAAELSAEPATPDQEMFLQWRTAYLERLAAARQVEPASRIRLLTRAVAATAHVIPKTLLVGFNDLKPDLAALIAALAATGSEISHWQPVPGHNRQAQLFPAVDAEAEVRAAALWARQELERGARRIGIVVPELQRYRPLFTAIFADELDPRAAVLGFEPPPFALSLGEPLANQGLVANALLLLGLGREWSLDDLSRLLRSPYLARDAASDRLRLDLELRLRNQRQLSWRKSQIARQLGRQQSGAAGRWLLQTLELLEQWSGQNRLLAAGDWSSRFLELLQRIGWPGSRGLSSREFQTFEKFRSVLQQFASLDLVLGRLSRQEAVSLLRRLCHDTPFQIEMPDCRIEVIGLLEAGGLQFDRLWLMGLHDGLLPGPLRPNPFLPYALQKRYRMPHADIDHEVDYSKTLLKQLFDAAPAVVASYPLSDGDSRIRAHYLIGNWPAQLDLDPVSFDPWQLIAASRPELELLLDERAASIHSRKVIAGGTGLLKDQALCPFRAFAHHRLKAIAPEEADIGLDPLMRGNLTHNLLEAFWRDCGDSRTLAAWSGQELARRLAAAASQALAVFERSEKRNLPARFRQLEQLRLERLGREWLQQELARGEFSVLVDQLEQTRQVDFGALQIRTRIDRVDRLASGRLAVIDYKTGQPDPLQWLDERITEPQLPVYARQYPSEQLGAILFGVVRAGGCRFRGLVDAADDFPGLPDKRLGQAMQTLDCDSLEAVCQRWDNALRQLADQFTSGWAAVDPIDENQACRFCDLTSLCRIRQTPLLQYGNRDD